MYKVYRMCSAFHLLWAPAKSGSCSYYPARRLSSSTDLGRDNHIWINLQRHAHTHFTNVCICGEIHTFLKSSACIKTSMVYALHSLLHCMQAAPFCSRPLMGLLPYLNYEILLRVHIHAYIYEYKYLTLSLPCALSLSLFVSPSRSLSRARALSLSFKRIIPSYVCARERECVCACLFCSTQPQSLEKDQ